tara:strand:- start:15409 stop:15810 length:402 start_codon:yes stop_codon:yes gene_type:complete
MVRFMKLAGLLYMILVMVLYFTFIDVMNAFEQAVGRTMASFILIAITVTGFLSLMALMKRTGSGPMEGEGAEEIDFSKNSPTVDPKDAKEVKPIDYTGNVFEHNFETLEEDLSFLDKNAQGAQKDKDEEDESK